MTSAVLAEYISPQACAGEKISDLGIVYYLPQDLPGASAFLQSGQTARVQHVDDLHIPTQERAHLQKFGAYSTLMIRLEFGTEIFGYVSLWESRQKRIFTAAEIALCQSIAQQAAIAIQNARLLEQTRQDAETKAMLLQEANHRVKNNLSTIIGLLYAERRHTDMAEHPVFQAIMQGLINRVQGLATAHSMLSATEWGPLSLSELTQQVIGSTLQALPSGKTVFVEVSPSPVRVAPQQANHLALVINELTVNTLKYALAEQTTIRIMVHISYTEGEILFEFQNDGPGYPREVLNSTRHSTGLYLVHNIVRKGLRGDVELYNNPGPTVVMRFPSSVE
jgi:two-component sensor histidine kinase